MTVGNQTLLNKVPAAGERGRSAWEEAVNEVE